MKIFLISLILILILILILFNNSWASDRKWPDKLETQDYLLGATYLVLHAVDWAQTLNIARNPDKWRERNGVLRGKPKRVNTIMAGSAILHVGVVCLLPKEYRPWVQGSSIIVKGYCVGKNFNLGIGVRW